MIFNEANSLFYLTNSKSFWYQLGAFTAKKWNEDTPSRRANYRKSRAARTGRETIPKQLQTTDF